jgi:hypothetical protein
MAMRRFWLWFFQSRETGAITIAQAPNLLLWLVIAASILEWGLHPDGRQRVALDIVVKGGLLLWALDEVLRGVNPWRRCLGISVLVYIALTLRV